MMVLQCYGIYMVVFIICLNWCLSVSEFMSSITDRRSYYWRSFLSDLTKLKSLMLRMHHADIVPYEKRPSLI